MVLKITAVSLGAFKEFLTIGCCDMHKKMLQDIEGEYNLHCDENKITHENSDYFDDLFGYIDSGFVSKKSKEDFMSIFFAFINWSNSKDTQTVNLENKIVHDLGDDAFSDVGNIYKPKKLRDRMTDEEYERGFFQFMNVTSKGTSRIFKKVIRKYNKFLTSIDDDVEDFIKLEEMSTMLGRKKVFISDNGEVVYEGETYVSIENNVAQTKKCVASDYIGKLGVARYSISHFISSN